MTCAWRCVHINKSAPRISVCRASGVRVPRRGRLPRARSLSHDSTLGFSARRADEDSFTGKRHAPAARVAPPPTELHDRVSV